MKHRIFVLLMVVMSGAPATLLAGFPEIPFCPLGGPPGWFNRVFDSDDRRYYYPPSFYYRPGAPTAGMMPRYSYPGPVPFNRWPGRRYSQ